MGCRYSGGRLDPFRGYGAALSAGLPHAVRVLDAFHVVRLGFAAVDDVRRRVQQHTCGHRGRRDDPLYGIRRVLRRGAEHLTTTAGRLLAGIEAGDHDGQVTAAWVAAQELRAIYRCRDRDQASARLYDWTVTCIDSHVPELPRLARTLTTWRAEFLAYFSTGRISNGPTEAVNLLIKKILRVAHGFRNFHNYRLRLLLHCGITSQHHTPTPLRGRLPLHFGRLTGKAYTKGERVLRFDAIAHNTAELRCGKMIDKFAEIVTRLAGIAERFATALDCVDTGFIRDAILDGLPTGVRLGATRIGVSTSTNPGCATRCAPPGRWRRRPTGSPPPSSPPRGTPAPGTITSATASARRPTACANCGANGSTNPAEPAATTSHPWRTIAALLTLRDQLIAPILAAVRSPAWDTNPRTGHASTATTNESASICKRSSTISPSKPS